MSRTEALARKLRLNVTSPTTREVLNSLDDNVSTFVGQYRQGKILKELPTNVLDMSVAEAFSTARKCESYCLTGDS